MYEFSPPESPQKILINKLIQSTEVYDELLKIFIKDSSVQSKILSSLSKINEIIEYIEILDIYQIEYIVTSNQFQELLNEDKDLNKNSRYEFSSKNLQETLINKLLQSKKIYMLVKIHIKDLFAQLKINSLLSDIDDLIKYIETSNINDLIIKYMEASEIIYKSKNSNKSNTNKNIEFLNNISIKNFFSISEINLTNLKNKKEIYIVGENGDGKTLLLQAISVGLKGTQEDGLKEFRVRENEFTVEIKNKEECKNNFLAYGSSRNNSCQIEEDKTGYLSLFSGKFDLKSPIKWLQYLDYSEQKGNNNVLSVLEAKKLLQELLNSDIEIDINPDKVTFTEKGSEVSFEQLSSGYRGVITIICDLIARLSEKQRVANIKDFQGIVLIDEVELHLHPKWQYSFMNKLRKIFPLIQFMVTTHSPTVLLGASMDAVYYQIYKDNGVVKISEQKEVKNDFLNDIQSDIFGFDVNDERINNPTDDDKKRQKRAKENLLNLIDTIDKGE